MGIIKEWAALEVVDPSNDSVSIQQDVNSLSNDAVSHLAIT